MADDDKPIQVNQLPQPAQTFIKQYFSAAKVAMAKMETDLFDKSYDVILRMAISWNLISGEHGQK